MEIVNSVGLVVKIRLPSRQAWWRNSGYATHQGGQAKDKKCDENEHERT